MISSLVTGLAEALSTATIGVWHPDTGYIASDVAIVVQDVPSEPDQIISVSGYPVQDDVTVNDSIIGTHIRFRGAPSDRMSLLDRSAAVFGLFQGIRGTAINDVTVVAGWRQGGGWIGRDDNLRWEYADTYYWRVTWPTTYRTD